MKNIMVTEAAFHMLHTNQPQYLSTGGKLLNKNSTLYTPP